MVGIEFGKRIAAAIGRTTTRPLRPLPHRRPLLVVRQKRRRLQAGPQRVALAGQGGYLVGVGHQPEVTALAGESQPPNGPVRLAQNQFRSHPQMPSETRSHSHRQLAL